MSNVHAAVAIKNNKRMICITGSKICTALHNCYLHIKSERMGVRMLQQKHSTTDLHNSFVVNCVLVIIQIISCIITTPIQAENDKNFREGWGGKELIPHSLSSKFFW